MDEPANSFPYPVPPEIRVPQWALIDITVRCDLFIPPALMKEIL